MKFTPLITFIWAFLLWSFGSMAQNASGSFPNALEQDQICNVLIKNNQKRLVQGFDKTFESFMNTLRDAAKERGIILSDIALLNTYNHRIHCTDKTAKLRHKLALFKYPVGVGDFDFLLEILETGNYKSIDLNQVEMINGTPETLLDYVNKLMTKTNSRIRYQILRKLKGLLIKSGAKKAKDL